MDSQSLNSTWDPGLSIFLLACPYPLERLGFRWISGREIAPRLQEEVGPIRQKHRGRKHKNHRQTVNKGLAVQGLASFQGFITHNTEAEFVNMGKIFKGTNG